MRYLLLLLALSASAQSNWPEQMTTCACCSIANEFCCALHCTRPMQLPREYGIEWLRPGLDLGPAMRMHGAEGFSWTYIMAPRHALFVHLPDGRIAMFTREEIEGRAKQ